MKHGVSPEKSFHSTHHGWASGAIVAGWDWESICAQMAHSNAAFTASVYVHGTECKYDLDWAKAPVKAVMDRSFGSQDTLSGDDDEPKLLSGLEKVARPARLACDP